MTTNIRVQPAGNSQHDDPDGSWRTLWGYVYEGDQAHAVYYVRWNDAEPVEAEFVVSIGEWDDESDVADRVCVATLAKEHQGRLSFMLIDAASSSFADESFLGSMRDASDVRGTELALAVFRILDEVLVADSRVVELRLLIEG